MTDSSDPHDSIIPQLSIEATKGTPKVVEDKKQLLETTPHFTSINPDTGLLETRHAATGDLLAIQSSLDESILLAKESRAVKVLVDGKEIYLEAGVSADNIKKTARSGWIYSQVVGDSIAQLISEGWTLTKICKTEGFPNVSTIAKWRREHEDFDLAVKQAFQNRGEYHRDKATTILEESETSLTNPDDTPIYKYQTEAHLKLASLDNHERFGNKTKVEGEISVAHFILDTGIRRPEDPGYFKDQSKVVQELKGVRDEKTNIVQDSLLPGREDIKTGDGGDNNSGEAG